MTNELEPQPEKNREIKNYYPFELPVQTIPIYFKHDLERKGLIFILSTWLAPLKFENEEPAFPILSQSFTISGVVYEGIYSDPQYAGTKALLNSVTAKVKEILGIDDAEETLSWFEIDGLSREILSDIDPKLGFMKRNPKITQYGNGFDQTMQANREMMKQVYMFCIGWAASQAGDLKPFWEAQLANAIAKAQEAEQD